MMSCSTGSLFGADAGLLKIKYRTRRQIYESIQIVPLMSRTPGSLFGADAGSAAAAVVGGRRYRHSNQQPSLVVSAAAACCIGDPTPAVAVVSWVHQLRDAGPSERTFRLQSTMDALFEPTASAHNNIKAQLMRCLNVQCVDCVLTYWGAK